MPISAMGYMFGVASFDVIPYEVTQHLGRSADLVEG